MSQPLQRFPGGLQLAEHKAPACDAAIECLPLPARLRLPLRQHRGVAAEPVVNVGEQVHRGQLLARAADGISAHVHAPAAGMITAIGEFPVIDADCTHATCIELQTAPQTLAGQQWWSEELVDDSELTPDDVLSRIVQAGIVGLGGAGFPTAGKLQQRTAQLLYLIINGAECEPYISCDDRLMRERADLIVQGVRILARLLQPAHILFAIEDNKPEAISAVSAACDDTAIDVRIIPSRYPSGAQKQLIQILLGIEIADAHHSVDYGISMLNVGTCEAIARALTRGEPLISRIVTVTGGAVKRPGNYEVPLGSSVGDVLRHADCDFTVIDQLILGGPLMGLNIADLDAPISKLGNCIIASTRDEIVRERDVRECIRCGDCAEVCPASLLPQQLYWFIRSEQYERAQDYALSGCIECGACAYVCPSQLPLVDWYRQGKAVLKTRSEARQRSELARQRFEARSQRLERQQQAHAARLLQLAETRRLQAAQHAAAAPAAQMPAEATMPDATHAAKSADADHLSAPVATGAPVSVPATEITAGATQSAPATPTAPPTTGGDALADVLAAAARARAKKRAGAAAVTAQSAVNHSVTSDSATGHSAAAVIPTPATRNADDSDADNGSVSPAADQATDAHANTTVNTSVERK